MAHRPLSKASSNGTGLKLASAPFDKAHGADIALRTSDDTVFLFRKCLLIAASPFFSNLFADGVADKTFRGLPLCPVVEDSETMHFILRLCSPDHISMEDLWDTIFSRPVLSSLNKYIMVPARQRVVTMFEEGATMLIEASPLRAFALARALEQDSIARKAARQLLCVPMNKWATSGQASVIHVTGNDYHCLVQYFLRCGQAAYDAADIGHTTIGVCAICSRTFSSHSGNGLRLGASSAVHVWKDGASVYTNVVRLQSFIDARDIFRQCPGTKELPKAVVQNLCETSRAICGLQWDVVLAQLNLALEAMFNQIDAAIDKIPLELDDVPQ